MKFHKLVFGMEESRAQEIDFTWDPMVQIGFSLTGTACSLPLWCRSGLVSQELLVLYPLLSTLCLMLQRRKRKPHIKVGFVIPVKWLASYRILEERERRFIRSKRTFQIPFPSFQFLQIPFTSFQFLQFHFPSFQFLQIPLIFLQSKHNLKLYLVGLKI